MVCDAPDLFPPGSVPTSKYEGGSLKSDEQWEKEWLNLFEFTQRSFSRSYAASQGSSGGSGYYGIARGQAFNEMVIANINATLDARSYAYSKGVPYDEFGLSRTDLLKMWNKRIPEIGETFEEWAADRMAGAPPTYTQPPKGGFPGFPDAERVKPKGGRPRWKLPDGDVIEWDGQHRELERYGPNRKHKGVWNPKGEMIKNPRPERRLHDPFVDKWYVPSQETIKNTLVVGTVVVGAAIIIFDIVTVPSGEGLVGVQMIRMAIAK
jgi:hypothetical protein